MNDEKQDRLEYDVQRRAKAGTSATLRTVVALYVIYMGYRLIHSAVMGEESTMSLGLRWGFGIGMIVLALGFGVYIWRRLRADVAAARLPKNGEMAGNAAGADDAGNGDAKE